ncbi:MAG: hypothetical protein LLG16_02660 [Euryarchaeota archaeon]|nr:hypothetical protein [Euryarchaeota archaeon]
MLKRDKKGQAAVAALPGLNKVDRKFSLVPSDIGENWEHIVPDKIKLSEERPYAYREVKGFALKGPSTENLAQLLIVLFDFGDEDEAKGAFKEIGKGLESEMPKIPNVGDESVVYELDLMPSVQMRIMAFRYGQWLVTFTLWLFKGQEVEDQWIKDLLEKQHKKIKSWRSV